MIVLEELEARHRDELADYEREREKRFVALRQQQKELFAGVICTNPTARGLLDNLLHEQRQSWEANEKHELDLLNHAHSYERESFFEKEAKRDQIAGQIVTKRERPNDREI